MTTVTAVEVGSVWAGRCRCDTLHDGRPHGPLYTVDRFEDPYVWLCNQATRRRHRTTIYALRGGYTKVVAS